MKLLIYAAKGVIQVAPFRERQKPAASAALKVARKGRSILTECFRRQLLPQFKPQCVGSHETLPLQVRLLWLRA